MVVDDSTFFRKQIGGIIDSHPEMEVIAYASNGYDAIELAKELRPDLITMDVDMPEMNGIEASKKIKKVVRTKILIVSSLTRDGAKTTLESLSSGADDYLLKDTHVWIRDRETASSTILNKILALTGKNTFSSSSLSKRLADEAKKPLTPNRKISGERDKILQKKADEVVSREQKIKVGIYMENKERGNSLSKIEKRKGGESFNYSNIELVVIGASTGGPALLQKLFNSFDSEFNLPILIVQHMPASFTKVFADRLNQNSKISVKEAEDGDRIERNVALLAPGGKQMIIDPNDKGRVKIIELEDVINYRPCVDVTMGSAARTCGAKTLGIILTGMGADGTLGANEIRKKGGAIWSQDEESCTVYGMPQSIANLGLYNKIVTADNLSNEIKSLTK